MNKTVFVDCGARIGETIDILLNKRPEMKGCDVYFFECNENHFKTLEDIVENNKDYNFTLRKEAVWDKDEIKDFYLTNDIWGDLGCTLKPEKREKMDKNNPTSVQCIDFSNFIKTLGDDKKIIVKLDIEGAEYEVIQSLIDSGAINLISELYVEFHDHFFVYGLSNDLKSKLMSYKHLSCNFDWE